MLRRSGEGEDSGQEHIPKSAKNGGREKSEKKIYEELRGQTGRWINLVEDVRKTQRGQRTKSRALGIFRVSLSYPILLYSTLSTIQ